LCKNSLFSDYLRSIAFESAGINPKTDKDQTNTFFKWRKNEIRLQKLYKNILFRKGNNPGLK
jgi:hypothetical protein